MDAKEINLSEQAVRLREKLNELKWPQTYMFKFVMPNKQDTVNAVVETLPTLNARTSFNNSRNGNYVSITCVCTMHSADEVMKITTEASAIDGVLAL